MPGCKETGLYPAPKSRESLRDYQWLCLEHIKIFNATWDFLKGKNAAEIEFFIRQSTVGERPTRPLTGGTQKLESILRNRVFGDAEHSTKKEVEGFTPEEIKACRALGLPATKDFKAIKARYRQLAKQLHPDVNAKENANAAEEEKLKMINQAYAVLKSIA